MFHCLNEKTVRCLISFGFPMRSGFGSSLLPTDVRGKARVDDRCVLSGIVHTLR